MFQFPSFPSYSYGFTVWYIRFTLCEFPHSDIRVSMTAYVSSRHFVVCHVLLRLLVPRHSPHALFILTFVTSYLHDFFFSVSLLKLFIFSMSRSLIHQFFCSLRRINWEFVANVLPSIFFSFLVKKLGKASSLLFSYAIFKVLRHALQICSKQICDANLRITLLKNFPWVAIKQHKTLCSP